MFFYLLIILVSVIVWYLRHIYSYWERNGYPSIPASIPFGNLKSVAFRQRSFGLSIYDLYVKTKEPFIGVYLFFRPVLLIRDPELVRKMLVEEFQSFHDRGVYCNEERDPMSATLFAMSGPQWKAMRQKLTPTFSSGKLKGMFETILNVGQNLENHIVPLAEKNEIIDIKDVFQNFTLDVIANVIFGLEVNTIANPKHEFKKMAVILNTPNLITTLRLTASFLCPQVLDFFRLQFLGPVIGKFLTNIVQTTMEHREKNNILRKDFMQLLLQLRNTGEVKDDNWKATTSTNTIHSLSVEQCAAQVFIFYIAGFETTSSTMSYCMYELAQHPDMMKKLQTEIDSTLAKNDGKITYELIQEMKFLDCCVNEALRKYPSLAILNRVCTKDYQIPGSKFKIDKGTGVIMSLFGIHRDPNIFPHPDAFRPERFEEGHKDFNEKYFLPFGDGPRNCIGYRMGKMVSKIGLVLMLKSFTFTAMDNKEIEFDPAPVNLIAKGGIRLRVTKR